MKIIKYLLLTFTAFPSLLFAQQWQPKQATLMTRFAKDVTENPLPEYPRPQMTRAKWLNLNGVWQFQPAKSKTEALTTKKIIQTCMISLQLTSLFLKQVKD